MKLVNRKTRKAIKKSVRKAMKKHGPTLLASLTSALASTLATLAKTEAPGKRGKSNLADLAERMDDSITHNGSDKSDEGHLPKKKKQRVNESTDPAPSLS